MPSIRSFSFLLFGIFLSFFLTSCIPDPEGGQEENFTISGNISSGGIFLGEQEDAWNFSDFLSGEILSLEEGDEIQVQYASGESREFIPYSVFGSGDLLIEDISITFRSSTYIPYQNRNSSSFGGNARETADYIQFFNTQRERQIEYYNALFGKTPTSELIENANGKYSCLEMNGNVKKAIEPLGTYTQISAIGGIPADTTPLSEQFPLDSPTVAQNAVGQVIGDGYYWTRVPTHYEDILGKKYFLLSTTRNIVSSSSSSGQRIPPEIKRGYMMSLVDCTLSDTHPINHFTIHLMPPAGYAWSGQTVIDYRLHLQGDFLLHLPIFGKPHMGVLTTNTGEKIKLSIAFLGPDDADIYMNIKNGMYCLNDEICTVILGSEALQNIASIELFYDTEER